MCRYHSLQPHEETQSRHSWEASRSSRPRWSWPCCHQVWQGLRDEGHCDKYFSKEGEGGEHLGADVFLVSSDAGQMQAAMGTMDGIINTVSAYHAITPLLLLLKTHGKMIMVGAPEKPLQLPVFTLIFGGKSLAGGCIGGIRETQEMIDFAGKHNIAADIELIRIDYLNKAMERLAKADVRYRFVINIGNSLTEA